MKFINVKILLSLLDYNDFNKSHELMNDYLLYTVKFYHLVVSFYSFLGYFMSLLGSYSGEVTGNKGERERERPATKIPDQI